MRTSLYPVFAMFVVPIFVALIVSTGWKRVAVSEGERVKNWLFRGGLIVSIFGTMGSLVAMMQGWGTLVWVVQHREDSFGSVGVESTVIENLSEREQDIVRSAIERGQVVVPELDFAGRMEVFIGSESYLFEVSQHMLVSGMRVPVWLVSVGACIVLVLVYNMVVCSVFLVRSR